MRLVHRVFAANALVVVPVLIFAAWLAHRGLERGFLRYVQDLELARLEAAQERLARIHEDEGGWDGLRASPERWEALLRRERDVGRDTDRPPPRADERPPPPPRDGEPPPPPPRDDDRSRPPRPAERGPASDRTTSRDPLEIPPRAVLFDADRRRVVGAVADADDIPLLPVVVRGETVGYLGLRPIDRLADELDVTYLRGASLGLAGLAGLGLVLALLASFLLARHVLEPIRRLTEGTARLRAGDYDVRIPVASGDELGALAADFEALARALSEAKRLEKSWLAEASHELRTPLAVLRAYLEAIEDGVREPNAETLGAMRQQVATLTRLVEDVHELARLDAQGPTIAKSRVAPLVLLERVFRDFELRFAERGLRATLDLPPSAVTLEADEARLVQLFTNLLENACRYTDAGGPVRVSAAVAPGRLRIVVEDGPPGVPPAQLSRIFRPFQRADPGRPRTHGGSGLGLAVCARIVAAHQGAIEARPSELGGLAVVIGLPT